jgi:hypothetical protein
MRSVAHEGKLTASHALRQWGSGRIADEKNSVLSGKKSARDACDFATSRDFFARVVFVNVSKRVLRESELFQRPASSTVYTVYNSS